MDLSSYAQALGTAQQLVPSYDQLRSNALAIQGQQLQNRRQQMVLADAEREAADDAAFERDFAALPANAGASDWRSLLGRHPRYSRDFGQMVSGLDKEAQRGVVTDFAQMASAIAGGRSDLAAGIADRHIKAAEASGKQPDPTDIAIRDAVASGDPAKIKGVSLLLHGSLAALDKDAAKVLGPDNENHFTSTGDGAIYDQRTGGIVRDAPAKSEYRTIKNADGTESIVEVSTGGGGQASGGGGGGSGQPRSVRNNNPGNIEDGPFARSQPGYKGTDGRFAIFDSPDAGAKAQGALLGSYIDRGFNTVGKIINRWAPQSDGNPTGAYVRFVAQKLGVNPADTLTKAAVPRLQAAIAEFEGKPGNASSGVPTKGGGRVVATSAGGAAAKPMTAAQKAQWGLDPAIAYTMGKDGKPELISGQSRPTRQALQLNEGQAKATGLLGRMVTAQNSLNEVSGYTPTAVALALNDLSNKNPIKGNLSQVDRRVLTAQLAFTNAVLRFESGAAIGQDETAKMAQTLFPLPGDGPEVQADKRRQREAAIAAMRAAAGPGSASVAKVKPNPRDRNAQVVSVMSRDQALALPPGTMYRAPDGKVRRR